MGIVGVALSGGGLRSACFGLGFLEVLCRRGVWKAVDYVSTVSGGGYIGGRITMRTLEDDSRGVRRGASELGNDDVRQSLLLREPIDSLVQRGDYLVRPWGLFHRWLIGAFLLNGALFSGLLAVACLIALLWRSLDYPWIRERAMVLGLGDDLAAPFWPALLLGTAWIIAWSVSFLRRQTAARGHCARVLLAMLVPSVVIGIAVLVGNGDIAGDAVIRSLFGDDAVSIGRGIWLPVVAVIAVALLPFLRPARLLQSGVRPQSRWEKAVFLAASTALLAGVPLCLVGIFSRENISGYNTDPHRRMIQQDIDDWNMLAAMVLRPIDQKSDGSAHDLATMAAESTLVRTCFAGLGQLAEVESIADDLRKAEGKVRQYAEGLVESKDYYDDWSISRPAIDRLSRVLDVAQWSLLDRENRVSLYMDARQCRKIVRGRMCDILNSRLLASRCALDVQLAAFRDSIVRQTEVRYPPASEPSAVPSSLGDGKRIRFVSTDGDRSSSVAEDGSISGSRYRQALRDQLATSAAAYDPAFSRLVLTALESGAVGLEQDDVVRLNRLLLEHAYPEVFRPRSKVRRLVSIYHDQLSRLKWLLAFTLAFGILSLLDINSLSMHQYYRDRLADAFISPKNGADGSPRLSEIDATNRGGPYHLISATACAPGTFLRRTQTPDGGEMPRDRRLCEPFLLSARYCGADATGYVSTSEYQHRVPGYQRSLSLADAIALSGAALSPSNAKNPLIAFLMVVLNTRLGQWLPNPAYPTPSTRPRILVLLAGLFRPRIRRPFCFITDGGVSENLGIIQLLRRRCRLIIATDAGYDPNHEFADLSRVIRVARIEYGIRFCRLDSTAKDVIGPDDEFHPASLVLQGECRKAGSDTRHVREHVSVARILYPEGDEGLLVYVKPSFTGDEPVDLMQYQHEHPEFPHESTTDQYYDRDQVEAYRELGRHIGESFLATLTEGLAGRSMLDGESLVSGLYAKLTGKDWPQPNGQAGDERHKTTSATAEPRGTHPTAEQVERFMARIRGDVDDVASQPLSAVYRLLDKDFAPAVNRQTRAYALLMAALQGRARDASDRTTAVRILQLMGLEEQLSAEWAVGELLETVLLHDRSMFVRAAAADAIAVMVIKHYASDDRVVRALRKARNDNSADVRWRARAALESILGGGSSTDVGSSEK